MQTIAVEMFWNVSNSTELKLCSYSKSVSSSYQLQTVLYQILFVCYPPSHPLLWVRHHEIHPQTEINADTLCRTVTVNHWSAVGINEHWLLCHYVIDGAGMYQSSNPPTKPSTQWNGLMAIPYVIIFSVITVLKYEGRSKSFATQYDAQMTRTKFLCYYSITRSSNAYVTFIKRLYDASQIEFLFHALQVRLRDLLDLIIIFEPCSCSAGCSKWHWVGIVVTLNLLTRSGAQWLWPISSSEEVVPGWLWDQTGHWVLSRTWTACQYSIWLASKSFLTDVTYVLLLRG